MQSFSQHGQDSFVYETFFKERKTPGYYVDVGAYDGVTFSNSLFFERHLGWQGVCIEPLPSAFDLLKSNRTALCINCAVADHNGVAKFVDVDMPNFGKMYSGLQKNYDPRHVEILRKYAKSQRTIKVELRRLADILKETNKEVIDYLSIDIEGGELKVLKTLDLNACKIHVISVENNYRDRDIARYLTGFGYRLIKIFAGFDDLYARDL